MLPSFFDSVLQLIVRTSTDLPPDVRAAMKSALECRAGGHASGQALTIIAQNIDLAVDTEGAICQDTGMPTFEVKTPVGANQIWMRQQIREAVAEATRRGKLRPELGRLDHRQELRRQPRTRHADHPFRSVGTGRDRGQADSQGRRLREHQRSIRAARRTAAPRDAPIATSTASRKCILHAVWNAQGKGAAPAPSASASAATGRPDTRTRRSSSFARSTM